MTLSWHHVVELLPEPLQRSATLRGNEHAWPPHDIPNVIEAGMRANLLNVGGQLQLRLPAATCECYWVQVDTFRAVPKNLPWNDRVAMAASEALRQFAKLTQEFDFVAEARNALPKSLNVENSFGNLEDATCFVWYLEAHADQATKRVS
ncbi:hypothetical protein [Mesorhizobium sp. KR9-304]|uniref:hypothetical protein n=1 Tax=Mesorhizobium sp. KR9-304 TaxID=3156614 RepID=UPI0032B3D23E